MPWDERTRKPPLFVHSQLERWFKFSQCKCLQGCLLPALGQERVLVTRVHGMRAGAFQRPTAPSPHVHLRSQNATVETGDKVPRSPIGCCFCASQNTCHPCQMLKRPGLLSEPRRNHGDTLSTNATQRRCAGQSPVRVSPQQVNPNTAPWATPVVTHTQGCSICLRKPLDSTRRCSIRIRPGCSLRGRSL